MIVKAKPGAIASMPEWNIMVRSAFLLDEQIKNHDFSFIFPEESKNKIVTEQGFRTPYYRVDGQFNYYSDYLNSDVADERQMISFYLFYNNEENKKHKNYDPLPNVKQMNKSLFSNFVMNYSGKYNYKKISELDSSSTIFFGSDYKLTKNFNKKDQFPLYNEINFSFQDTQSKLKNNLDKNNLLEQFICNMLYAPMIVENRSVDLRGNAVQIRYADLFSIVDNFKNHSENKIILTKKDVKNNISSFDFINKSILTSSIVKAMSQYRRYEQLLKNEHCDTEMIFFRVDKYLDSDLRIKTQSYHIPASSDNISILDTQIFNDKEYYYVVHAYVLVYGSSYQYSLESMWETRGSFEAELSIDIKPDFRIYEVEMFRTNSTVIETPLNKPLATFVNSSSETNKVVFRIEQPLMRLEQGFDTIEPSDEGQMFLMKQSTTNNRKYKFQHSKIQTKYEVFRTSVKPNLYSDFEGNKINEFDTSVGSTVLTASDYLLPNKKYYYIFRAVNITGKVSSPSHIYEVELTKEGGVSKVKSKTIDIKPVKNIKRSAPFKQLMQIVPSTNQRFLDEDSPQILNATSYDSLFNHVYLGMDSDIPIWDRKFKFRVRSKSTGKIIDFNIKFKIKKTRNVEDLK
jgi:hypothetical protein